MDLSPAGLFTSLVIGAVGYGLFRYGKNSSRPPQFACGLALMIFPGLVGGPGTSVGIGSLLLGLMWLSLRLGY